MIQSDQQHQQAMQQQDMQNQIAFDAQQQIAQAQVSKEVDKITGPDQGASKSEAQGRDHESKMMDKKIELEKIKSKKSAAPAAAKKKKTISEEAKELGVPDLRAQLADTIKKANKVVEEKMERVNRGNDILSKVNFNNNINLN